jgi:hypothetical protein
MKQTQTQHHLSTQKKISSGEKKLGKGNFAVVKLATNSITKSKVRTKNLLLFSIRRDSQQQLLCIQGKEEEEEEEKCMFHAVCDIDSFY